MPDDNGTLPRRPSNGVMVPLDEFVETLAEKVARQVAETIIKDHAANCDAATGAQDKEERLRRLEKADWKRTGVLVGVVAVITFFIQIAPIVAKALAK